MKDLRKILITFFLLLSMAVNVEALGQKSIYRQSSEYASASWTEVSGNKTITTSLYLTENDEGTYVSVNIYTWGPNYWSSKSGSTFTQDDIFKVSKNLGAASLSDINMEVYYYSIDETGEYTSGTENLTVKANWIGTGEVTERSSKYVSEYDDSISKSSETYLSREAVTTGIINSLDLGTSSYALLSSSEYTSMSMEK